MATLCSHSFIGSIQTAHSLLYLPSDHNNRRSLSRSHQRNEKRCKPLEYCIPYDTHHFQSHHSNIFIPKIHLDSNRHQHRTTIFNLQLQKQLPKAMTQYLIQSSNITYIGYDEVNQVLEIEFKLNVIHQYFEVPLSEFIALMKSENTEEFYLNFIQCKYHFDTF